MITDTLGQDSGYWLLREQTNYRQVICIAILSGILAYVLTIYPLAYYGQFAAADVQGAAPVQEQEGAFLNRVFFPLAAGLSMLMYLLERGLRVRINLAVAIPFALFWVYIGATSFWSLSPSTSISKFIVFTLLLMAIVPAVAVVDSAERYLKPMFWVAVATLLLNLAFVFLTAPSAIGHTGIYSHKNSLGGAAAFCLIFLLYGISHPQRFYRVVGLLLVPVAGYILYRSQAKTALGFAFVAPTIAAMAVFARHYFRMPIPLLLGVATPVVAFVLLSDTFDLSVTDASLLITGDPTFTGRTVLWQFAVERIAERPWFGYGFQSFWQVGDISPAWEGVRGFLQRTPHAHQGYLDLLLQGGIIALGLFLILLFAALNWISVKIDEAPPIGWLLGALTTFSVLTNLLETSWLSNLDPNTVLFLIAIAAAMVRQPAYSLAIVVQEGRPV